MRNGFLCIACSITLIFGLGCGSDNGNSSKTPPDDTTQFSLSSGSYDFGANIVGNTVTQTVVTVKNLGNNPLTIAPALSGDASFSLASSQSCGTTVGVGVSCNEVVSYTPTTASAPAQQTATLNLNPSNATGGTQSTVTITGTSGTFTTGTVSTTDNVQVALYSITSPFPGTVKVNFGRDATYGLSTWSQPTAGDGTATSIFVAGMLQNTTYQMQASITFANGVTVMDTNHTFTTGSLPATMIPQMTVATSAGQTPQAGIEMVNPCCFSTALRIYATDLAGNIVWAYQPKDTAPGANSIYAPKMLPNGDILFIISPESTAPLETPLNPGTLYLAREINLAGDTVRQISLADLNAKLAAAPASCTECSGITLLTYHHEITPLPNGHWLILSNVLKSVTLTGQTTPTNVLGDVIVDLDENLNPVWAWNEFNHLDVNRHPMNFPDWTHTNAIVYSPSDGDIIVSMRHQNWVVKVNYQNGQGDGSIVWKLGEEGDFALENGTDPTDWFYAQHWPSFTTANSSGTFGLTLMDNGNDRQFPTGVQCGVNGGPACHYTTVPVFQIDEDAKTATLQFQKKLTAYNNFGGGAQVLANGDLEYDLCGLSTANPNSEIDEITQGADSQLVWKMQVTGTTTYRAWRVPSLYPGVSWSGTNF